jgi:competence protein ComEC
MWPLLAALQLAVPPRDTAVLLVRVLDVSDARIGGDAILITDSAGGRARHVLVDASDHGTTVVAWLQRFHVDTLAALILSHAHADHYGGMDDVLDAVPVTQFVYGGTPRTAVTYRRLLAGVAARRLPTLTADSGLRRLTLVTARDTIVLELLPPPPDCRTLTAGSGDAVNDCSLGVRLVRGAFRMLLPGDAEQPEQAWWLTEFPGALRADVLKAAHHGSDNGTDPALLDAVQPRAVLISANGRQHPFADVLALLATRGIPAYCTADQGTLTVRVPAGGAWRISTERAGACHPRTTAH